MVRFLFLVVGLFAVVSPAQAGWLQFFFPTLESTEPDPTETLTAPFAMEPKKEGDAGVADQGPEPTVADYLAGRDASGKPLMPENAIALDQPHRSNADIVQWVMTAVSEALMFDKPDFNENLKSSEVFFSPSGRAQYLNSLAEMGITETLKGNQFDIRSFVSDRPILLNEGVAEGHYKWLYDAELMVTYLNRGVSEYANAVPTNKKMNVRVQLGRSQSAQNRDEVWIETWKAKLSE